MRPVQNTLERVETVKHMKWVDEVIPNAPLVTTLEFMEQNKLDLILISPEYDTLTDHYYAEPRAAGKVIVGSRYQYMSSSDIISRIKSRSDL